MQQKLRTCYRVHALYAVLLSGLLFSQSTYAGINHFPSLSLPKNDLVSDIAVTGKVIDAESGEPLPGVSIVLKGTTRGVTTDSQGGYSINVVNPNSVLVFSYVGYESQEIPVGNRTNLTISLRSDSKSLNEVVVVGYGEVKKRDLTGSVAQIDDKEVRQTPITSPEQALQGRIAGLQLTQSSGAPGAGTSVRIRGTGSFTGSNEPLYVIDGFPVSGGDNNVPNPIASGFASPFNQSSNPLNTIDPSDILSIEVLKDASSTAIYGSRGSNGVILITTKRGQASKTRYDFSYYTGVQQVTKLYDMANASETWDILNDHIEARTQTGKYTGITSPSYINPAGVRFMDKDTWVRRFGEGTNWQKELFQDAPMTNYSLNISGGNPNLKYAISGSYQNQEGVIPNSGFKRYSARVNLDAKASERLNFGTSLMLTRTQTRQTTTGSTGNGAGDVVYNALNMNPIIPVRDSTGAYVTRGGEWDFGPNAGSGVPNGLNPTITPVLDNPLLLANLIDHEIFSNRVLGNFFGEVRLAKGLKLRSNVGLNFEFTTRNLWIPAELRLTRQFNGVSNTQSYASKTHRSNFNILQENYLTYDKTFNKNNILNVVAGFSTQQSDSEQASASGANFSQNVTTYNDLASGSIALTSFVSSSAGRWTLMSTFVRLNYNLKDRYLFTFTGRADGSSRFAPNKKWGYFPSGAVAWRMSDEPFMKGLKFIKNWKWRVSYGITGNSEIGNYAFASRLGASSVAMGASGGNVGVLASEQATIPIGYGPAAFGNADLRWEKNQQFNAGLDVGFLENRIQVTADFYNKVTKDLLFNVSIPSQTGFGSAVTNVGSIRNRGLEFALNTVNLTGRFTWRTNANIAFNRNTLLAIDGKLQGLTYGNTYFSAALENASIQLQVGDALGNFFGYRQIGWFNSQEEVRSAPTHSQSFIGAKRFQDTNGDGRISADDREIIGNSQPKFVYGFTNNFAFQGFDLSVFFQGVYGNNLVNTTRSTWEQTGGLAGRDARPKDYVGNYWTPTNNGPEVKYGIPGSNQSGLLTDRMIEDGSYLRLKNVNLGYNLPMNKLKLKYIRSVRVYVSGTNLYTWTKYSGYDPEVNSLSGIEGAGYDRMAYPNVRTLLLGLNLGL